TSAAPASPANKADPPRPRRGLGPPPGPATVPATGRQSGPSTPRSARAGGAVARGRRTSMSVRREIEPPRHGDKRKIANPAVLSFPRIFCLGAALVQSFFPSPSPGRRQSPLGLLDGQLQGRVAPEVSELPGHLGFGRLGGAADDEVGVDALLAIGAVAGPVELGGRHLPARRRRPAR